MNRLLSVLCIVAAALFGALAAFVLVTKLTSPSARAVILFAAFVVAALACSPSGCSPSASDRTDALKRSGGV